MEPLSGELWLHMNKPLSQRSNEHTSCEKENHYQVKILENNDWETPTIADDLLVYFPLWKHKCIQEQKCSDLRRIWKAFQFLAQYLTTSWKDTPLDPFHCTVLSIKDTRQLCLFTLAWVQVQRTSSKLCWTKWSYAHSTVTNFKKLLVSSTGQCLYGFCLNTQFSSNFKHYTHQVKWKTIGVNLWKPFEGL